MKLLMKETGVEPDSISLVIILSAAASLSALTKGKEIRGFMLEGSMVNSLVDMYARCGSLENANMVFICTRSKSLSFMDNYDQYIWNAWTWQGSC